MKKLVIVCLATLLSGCEAEYPYGQSPDGRPQDHRNDERVEWRNDSERRQAYDNRYDSRYYRDGRYYDSRYDSRYDSPYYNRDGRTYRN